ncbi:glucosidase 2 subunit beta [Histomonas meleagridis]|uniref:glucosidase 2 subunit beta n=1 Tax=Histomonas meleagridis TaxID=135588 RepID=UPI00355A62A7|nr:glucosidase 2 subunit beta [Histomonas meleagridis]KAH0802011.1 glucosidase 2 subunit beta [Histomonas meleagridis]
MLLVLLESFVFSIAIHGIDQDLQQKYNLAIDENKGTFTCFDNSKVIPLSKLNDNYRDCDDGSDEPETQEGNLPNFYCQNDGYIPYYISRWSVNDGLCDCCDGSDELHNPHANCSNTCSSLEAERQKLLKELTDSYNRGIKESNKLKAKGESQESSHLKQKESIQSKISLLRSQIQQLETLKKEQVPQTPPPAPTSDNSDSPDEDDEEEPHNEDYSSDEENAYSEEGSEQTEVTEDESEQTETKSEKVTDEEENENKNESEEATEEESEQTETNDEEATEEVTEEPNEQNNEKPKESEVTTTAPNTKSFSFRDFLIKLWQITFFIDSADVPTPENELTRQYDKQISALRSRLQDLEREERDLNDKGKVYEKGVSPQFYTLYDKEFTNGNVKMRFMNYIEQDHTKLGNFHSYENGTMKYENGQYCWQTGRGRKSDVVLMCWSENKLLSTVEMSQCEYRVIFATPAACNEQSTKSLYNMTVDKLMELKEIIGF